jgi:hypothetical protein
MALPPRRYFSEVTLALNTRNALIIPPDQLMSGKEIPAAASEVLDTCHIYQICRRPGLSFAPEDFHYELPISTGTFIRKIDGKEERHPFKFPIRNRGGGEVRVASYPHKEIVGYNAKGEEEVVWSTLISCKAQLDDPSINDLEVLYVGQAFGDGTRTAFERLQNHKTLQKILADTHANRPDDEILLLLFEYEPAKAFVHMDGRRKDAKFIGDEDTQHLRSILDNPLSTKEEISIAEAGLIWYFRPHYNIMLKDSYPKQDLKLLQSLYSLDFNGLVVEINTEEFPLRIWSAERKPGHHHIAQFDLHDPKLRRTFFSLVDDAGQMTILGESGPVY